MGELLEIAKVAVEPTMKLLNMLERAVGIIYEPHHMKKMADAEEYRIKKLSQSITENGEVSILYDKGDITIQSTETDDFLKRCEHRASYKQIQQQKNIEKIAAFAYQELACDTATISAKSDEQVDEDWETRLFRIAEDISSEKMQYVWGKILAGEIKNPGSFSLRTLESIKNLSQKDAMLFQKISPFISEFGRNLFLTSDTKILKKYDISYEDILSLDECGLINSDGMVSFSPILSIHNNVFISNKSQLLRLQGSGEKYNEITFGIFGLTQAGRELFSIIDYQPSESYLCDLGEDIEKNNKGNVTISLHKIYGTGDNAMYETSPLREFPAKNEVSK